jgi:exopolysaccharide biosynthesis protein
VVSNTRSVETGVPVRGRLLLGRGAGAATLAEKLPVGSRARIAVFAAGAPQAVVGGRQVLVAGGEPVTSDDGELHPRTAVGIDSDTGKVLLVVVDGRSESSSGLTLLELADLMVQLGADEALNLDGGGSSTMAVTPPAGALTVANVPSDGQQRPIPVGLELVWSPPAA